MGATLGASRRSLIRTSAARAWSVWIGDSATAISRALMLGAATLLFLSAAATLEASFTMTASYALALLAAGIGAPAALRGWLRLTPFASLAAAAIVAIYIIAAWIGTDAVVPSQAPRSSHRDLAYVLDLILGFAVVGLVVDAFRDRRSLRRLVVCLCFGGFAAAAYAIYQWPAQHFGLPFADVNNAVNSDGFTRGHRFQGVGLFGWERVRGTFKEPLFLASYLATLVPLCLGLAAQSHRGERMLWLAGSTMITLALVLTVSSLAWAALGVVLFATAAVWAVQTGRVRLAGATGCVLVILLMLGPILFVNPSIVSGLTGRSPDALRATSQNRLDAWTAATRTWSARPVLGFGPGQSAIQLAYRPSVAPDERAPIVLGSAQGLWAASLLDTGIIGLFGWMAFFAAVCAIAADAIARRPSAMLAAAASSTAIAVLLANMAGDRLDLRVWVVLALLAAAASSGSEREAAAHGENSEPSAQERPAPGRTVEHSG